MCIRMILRGVWERGQMIKWKANPWSLRVNGGQCLVVHRTIMATRNIVRMTADQIWIEVDVDHDYLHDLALLM